MADMVGLSAVEAWRRWWQQQASTDDLVVSHAGRQGFVLASADLAALAVSRQRARTLVRRGRWSAAGYGHVTPLQLPDSRRHRHAVASAALARRRTGDAISGRSAAILHGLPTMALPARPQATSCGRPTGLGRSASGHRYGAALSELEVATWYGVPVTAVGRTLVDLARHDRMDAIMAVDAALRSGLIGRSGIDTALGVAAGWPGIRQARQVLSLASDAAESPLESLTRLRLHDEGFPSPELQAWFDGYRTDFYWPELAFVLEADGRGKYTDDELWAEKRRELALRRMGLRVERVTWVDITRDWAKTADWLRPILCPPGTRLPREVG